MKNERSMSHNVCYGKLFAFNGYTVYGWSVTTGDVVYDSSLRLYGVVEDFAHPAPDGHPAVLYVRFVGGIKGDFTAVYNSSDSEQLLTVPFCSVVCPNGPVVLGDEVQLVGFLGCPRAVVMKIKGYRLFCRHLSEKVPFSVWVDSCDVRKINKR